MIDLAKSKGFEFTNQIRATFLEAWMPPNEIFCNTAGAVVAWWLRERHKLKVWVEPIGFNMWCGLLQYFGLSDKQEAQTYELAFMAIITKALNALPDAS